MLKKYVFLGKESLPEKDGEDGTPQTLSWLLAQSQTHKPTVSNLP